MFKSCKSKEEVIHCAQESEDEQFELLKRQCLNIVQYTNNITEIRRPARRRILELTLIN